MHIIVVGVDYTTAPIDLREQIACPARTIPQLLQAARQVTQECVLLSTCNRFEFYAVCEDIAEGHEALLQSISDECQIPFHELRALSYCFADESASAHLFGVASGLYSLVPGEPQIQGQVVEALEIAQGSGHAGPIMSALFRAAVVAGKRARSETGISRCAASLSHVAVQLARRLLPDFQQASVLLIGSGKMSELAARNLRDNGAQRLVIVNRTQANATELAQSLDATLRPFAELQESLVEADVVISSTKAPHTIITTTLMEQVLAQRSGRSLLLIDIALPRDVEAAVASLPGIYLYNLDDLQHEVEHGIRSRLQETEHVQAIIAEEVKNFSSWLASLSVVNTISDLRHQADAIRQQELARTLRQLAPTLSEHEAAAVQELTNRLVNKLLHLPTRRLKDAAAAGQGHVYADATRYLFGLEEKNDASNFRHESKQAGNDTNTLGCPEITSAVARS
jgi:glutamyl-tRNA reductase